MLPYEVAIEKEATSIVKLLSSYWSDFLSIDPVWNKESIDKKMHEDNLVNQKLVA
ncbi:hypothetical protein [Pedobacter hiemivivus]|nr:hypothetical protein [Pedobacter hiemivivus]